VSFVDFGEVALPDHIVEVEDVVLDLLAGYFLVGVYLAHY
jgi:hypothetical protein